MLQFITHQNERYSYLDGARAALRGGCRWIQLRMKDEPVDRIVAVGQQLARLCHTAGATLIIDDHADLVGAIGADGVHLGKNDMPVAEARRMLGDDSIIGATANTFDDIAAAVTSGADYIGLGPFRFTETKKRLSPILGFDGYRDIMERCRHEGLKIPVVAIGGITAGDIHGLMATGIRGIALSGSILRADNPAAETSLIIKTLNNCKI